MDVKQNFKVNFAQNRGPKKGNKSAGSYGYTSGYVNNGNFYNNGYKGGYTSSSFTGNAFGSNSLSLEVFKEIIKQEKEIGTPVLVVVVLTMEKHLETQNLNGIPLSQLVKSA